MTVGFQVEEIYFRKFRRNWAKKDWSYEIESCSLKIYQMVSCVAVLNHLSV